MTDATGTSSYVYDPFGELTSATNGANQTNGYGYDADGDTTTITYPLPSTATWAANKYVAYGYDHADQMTSVTDFNNHAITITSTPDDLPATAVLGSTGDTITTGYDPADNPSSITLTNSCATLQGFTRLRVPQITEQWAAARAAASVCHRRDLGVNALAEPVRIPVLSPDLSAKE